MYIYIVISQRYIKYTLVHSSKLLVYFFMSVLFRCSFKNAIFSRFLKVAIATSYFMNEVYNGGFAPEPSVSMLKETIALVDIMYMKLGNTMQN